MTRPHESTSIGFGKRLLVYYATRAINHPLLSSCIDLVSSVWVRIVRLIGADGSDPSTHLGSAKNNFRTGLGQTQKVKPSVGLEPTT
jgi:hypothetical protein